MLFKLHEDFDHPILEAFDAFISEAIENDVKEITISINSRGGLACVLEGFWGLIDNYRYHTKGTVVTRADGMAASCGSILLLEGDVRLAVKTSLVLIHNVGVQLEGKLQDLKQSIAEIEEFNKYIYKRALKNSSLSYRKMQRILEKQPDNDWILTPEELLKYRIINRFTKAIV